MPGSRGAAVRRQHHRRVRRLVRQPGRQPQLSRRLLQSQLARRSSTSRSARTTASSPAVPTWGSRRTFCPAGSGACSPCTVPKDFTPTEQSDLDDRRQRPDHEHSASPAPRLRHEPVHRDRGRQHAAGAQVRSERQGAFKGPIASTRDGARPMTASVSAPLPLHALGVRRREVHQRHQRAAAGRAPPPVTVTLVEVPRPRHRHVRQGAARRSRSWRAAPAPFTGKADVDRQVQRTWRLHAARHRQRLLR